MQQRTLVRLTLVTATLAQYSRESFAIWVLAGILPSGSAQVSRGVRYICAYKRLQAYLGALPRGQKVDRVDERSTEAWTEGGQKEAPGTVPQQMSPVTFLQALPPQGPGRTSRKARFGSWKVRKTLPWASCPALKETP